MNSPVQRPQLAVMVRADWKGIGAVGLEESLLRDVSLGDTDALYRLRAYFPDAYASLQGFSRKMKLAFEYESDWNWKIGGGPRELKRMDVGLLGCSPLADCLAKLDTNLAAPTGGGAPEVVMELTKFGAPAKYALLERTTMPKRDEIGRPRNIVILARTFG